MNHKSKQEMFMYSLHAIQVVGGGIFLWYAATNEFRVVAWLGVVIGMAALKIKQLAEKDARAFAIREKIEANGFKWIRWALAIGLVIVMSRQLAPGL